VFNAVLGAKILLALLLLFGLARIGLLLIPRVRIRTGVLETGFIAGMLALLLVTFLYGDLIANRGTKEEGSRRSNWTPVPRTPAWQRSRRFLKAHPGGFRNWTSISR